MTRITCAELVELILEFLSEELATEQRMAFEYHLRMCPNCGAYVETYRATIAVARALPRCDGGLPPSLDAKLRAALEAEGLG